MSEKIETNYFRIKRAILVTPLNIHRQDEAFVQFTLSSVKMAGFRHVWYGCIGYCLSFNL